MTKYNINNLPLVDMGVEAERELEGKLAACLLLYPKETLGLCNGLKFRVNIEAKRLWEKAHEIRNEIDDSDDEYKLITNLLTDLRIPLADQYKWVGLIVKEDLLTGQPIDPIDRIINTMTNLEATRGTAIWLDYVQKNHLLVNTYRGV